MRKGYSSLASAIYRLLPSVFDEETLLRPWMQDTRHGQVLFNDHVHTPPRQPPTLAPPSGLPSIKGFIRMPGAHGVCVSVAVT